MVRDWYWTPAARHTVAASYFAWALDAYDFFLLVFVFKDIAAQFGTSIAHVAVAVMLTLACRPIGAFVFGRLADRWGRRPVLMINVAAYSVFSFAIALSPGLSVFYVLCSAFGVAMGGVWGISASLSMEAINSKARGLVSGLLQAGYPSGYLLASLIYGFLYGEIGWRGMFMVGVLPAVLLVTYIHLCVPESPHFILNPVSSSKLAVLKSNWRLALYAILLMTCYNFLSHGTQDLYPTFLQLQHGFSPGAVKNIAVIYNIGAILGGLTFGSLSQLLGRRYAVIMATLLALPVIWLWAFSHTALMLAVGAFMMQVCVQGAWSVVPAHLNELSPAGLRGTFPGTCYQLGNLIASVNAVLQAAIAQRAGGNYAIALAGVATCAALMIGLLMRFGPEARHVEMSPQATGEVSA